MPSIKNVKESYTAAEWAAREAYYVEEVSKLVIPVDPNTKDIMKLTANIDAVLEEALLDLAYIKRKYQKLDTMMKLAEKETFAIIKQGQGPGANVSAKLTENDVKGLVVQYLKSHPLPNFSHDIYTLVGSVETRLVFIETVVKMLSEKKGALISDNAMMKIEAGMTSNTP